MQVDNKEFLWVEKYRPTTIADTILPSSLKEVFEGFVKNGEIPNLLLSGPAGVGKTTVAKAMIKETGATYLFVNGSLERGIDVLRNDISVYASSYSLEGTRKYVILDEADNLTATMQPALRGFIEQYSISCGFILTCNYKNKIIPPLQSRMSIIDFDVPKKEAPKLAAKFFQRAKEILKAENIEYDEKVLGKIVTKFYPDWRRVLNELQKVGTTHGKIDSSALSQIELDIAPLVEFIKDKNYTEVRHWVREHLNSDPNLLLRQFYDYSVEGIKAHSVPILVMLVQKYQYQGAIVSDPEVNVMAFLAEVMIEVEFQ